MPVPTSAARVQRNLVQNKLNTIHYGSPFDHHHPQSLSPFPSSFPVLSPFYPHPSASLAHKRSVEGGGDTEKLRIGNSLKLPSSNSSSFITLSLVLRTLSFFHSVETVETTSIASASLYSDTVKGVGIGKRCGLR